MPEQGSERNAVFVIYAHSRPGVLAKIASLLYRRGVDIHTLTVGATREADLSKIVLCVARCTAELERIAGAIGNLVDVLSVELSDPVALSVQELCLVRVAAAGAARAAVLEVAEPFRPTVWPSEEDSVVLQLAAAPEVIGEFLAALDRFPVLDISRSGGTTSPGFTSPSLREP